MSEHGDDYMEKAYGGQQAAATSPDVLAILATLTRIEARLTAIERHLDEQAR